LVHDAPAAKEPSPELLLDSFPFPLSVQMPFTQTLLAHSLLSLQGAPSTPWPLLLPFA
jgi:hypothetical protein